MSTAMAEKLLMITQVVYLSFRDGQYGFQIDHIGGKDGRRKKHDILKQQD